MGEPIRILCVDDERNVLRALERIFLDEDDYEVHTASSGQEGLKILREGPPFQLVISDYRMPGMDGVAFLRDVCKNWPDTVRIVLSGYADMAAVVSAINEGQIYKFIPKPWNDDELKITVSNAVERYFLHRRNAQLTEELRRKNEELRRINQDLERIIEERTSELRFQNRVLRHSQNILDSIPVGVVGMDADGLIVQCNRCGAAFLGEEGGSVLGRYAEERLPGTLRGLAEEVRRKGSIDRRLEAEGRVLRVRGIHIHHGDGQEGVALVLDGEASDG